MPENIHRINLWASPRNISTTLMYSFAQRTDTRVVDEPLYGYYLKNTQAKDYHPGAEEIIASMPSDGTKVWRQLSTATDRPVLFYKHMTHHLLDLPLEGLDKMQHIFLTRDPKEMILSFSKVIETPTLKDLGYADQSKLIHRLKKEKIPIVVVDARDLLMDPTSTLSELCEWLHIPFEKNMLTWAPGPRKEDGIWAKHWYANVHASSGFLPYREKTEILPERLHDLYLAANTHYQQLLNHTL